MRNIKIKEVMTPIENYITINEDQTLFDVFSLLDRETHTNGPVHRDLIVLDAKGQFKGKITMLDIFRALEPKYKQFDTLGENGTLTKESVLKAVREYDLWLTPVRDLCERGANVRVSQVMHQPLSNEFVHEEESCEKALHQYVVGVHQPLIVKDDTQVTGILRFEDLYKVIRDQMLTCTVNV